mmetsp:Transcript_3332/g.6919  ORF Transcript_3332/g.6919 Transcript_3332/m.6919 type:complete len:246 (-) Transcript_3332:756-1493(-)
MESLRMRATPRPRRRRKPLDMMACSTSCGTFFPPRAASTSSSSRYPPSSAGSGSTFTTARLMFTIAANWNRPAMSFRATSAPTATIAMGPDTWSLVAAKLKMICWRPPTTVAPSRWNSYDAMENTSPTLLAGRRTVSTLEASCTPMRPPPSEALSGITATSSCSSPRAMRNISSTFGLSLMRSTRYCTDLELASMGAPSTPRMMSPVLTPPFAAADTGSSSGTSTPGLKVVSPTPTRPTWPTSTV